MSLNNQNHDGLIESTDDESFDKCISCISGKMTRKPFTHVGERASDLLGLIHTDVCGPFRTKSREGANYFLTFTDDYSRYGYVYLLQHKHEQRLKLRDTKIVSQPGSSSVLNKNDDVTKNVSSSMNLYIEDASTSSEQLFQ